MGARGACERDNCQGQGSLVMFCYDFWVVERKEEERRLFVVRCWKARRRNNKYESNGRPRWAVKAVGGGMGGGG